MIRAALRLALDLAGVFAAEAKESMKRLVASKVFPEVRAPEAVENVVPVAPKQVETLAEERAAMTALRRPLMVQPIKPEPLVGSLEWRRKSMRRARNSDG